MADVYLVCEGDDHSLDFKVLNRIVVGNLKKSIVVFSAGGDAGLRSVARWLEKNRGGRAYSIEDRNYRSQQEVEQSWKADSARFIWRRHEIENYLLDPAVVTQTMVTLGQAAGNLPLQLPQTQTMVEAELQTLATRLFEDHVGQLTCARLIKELNKLELQFREPKNKLLDRNGWLRLLQQECQRLRQHGTDLSQLPAFADESLAGSYDQLQAELSQSDFLSSGQCLKEMDGKKLMAALLNFVKAGGFPRLSKSDLENEFIESLDRQYTPGYFASGSEPDDFVELANRLV